MKINKEDFANAFFNIKDGTENQFWGVLSLISTIDEVIKPGKLYTVNQLEFKKTLNALFYFGDLPNLSANESSIYVIFSKKWKSKLKSYVDLNSKPTLLEAAILYNWHNEYKANSIETASLVKSFDQHFNISKNTLDTFFDKDERKIIELEEYDYSELKSLLEEKSGEFFPDNHHLAVSKPFIKSVPHELNRAPFYQTLYSSETVKELLLVFSEGLADLYTFGKEKKRDIPRAVKFSSFQDALELAGMLIPFTLTKRFLISILTKRLLILTGLSGSGKTKLAESFCKWITTEQTTLSKKEIFNKDTIVSSDRVEYQVVNSDEHSVVFEQSDTGIRVTLSYEIIQEWVDVIQESNFSKSTPAREIREKAKKSTIYSSQEHSYETHLKAAAFYLIGKQHLTQIIKQFEIIPVGADWTTREPLLGYPNALEEGKYVLPESGLLQLILRAENDPERPYFLILDEMNLSHVERYFADFLSAIESNEKIKLHSGDEGWSANGYEVPASLTIPKNLFIIGTVNIDETTYMFSPKVLDRANVIEFRVSKDDMEKFLKNPADVDMSKLEGKGAGMAKDFVNIATNPAADFSENEILSKELIQFFKNLSEVGAEFGYRTANEISRFASLAEQLADEWEFKHIMDSAISQKLLPKLHGSHRKLEGVLFKLAQLCIKEGNAKELLKKPSDINWETNVIYPISLEKIVRMHKGLLDNGFTSFAEA